MTDLKLLVESIVTDLISARFEADVKATELAQYYREHPTLRAMNVPTLNISSVSLKLNVLFDSTPIAASTEPSDEQKAAVRAVAGELRTTVMNLNSVSKTVTASRAKTLLERNLALKLEEAALANLERAPEERVAKQQESIEAVLGESKVSLTTAERKALAQRVQSLDVQLAAAPKPTPKSMPRVIVGAEQLSKVDPQLVNTLTLNIEMDRARWVDVEDAEGGVESVLVNE
jgi:hypothetical protein